ncbi:dipeptide ABC transporter ATP-binding protein [Aureimonas populi]|uniref:Dipeptide ABC transporter ATP-binding protein n=1 Tax=Aureimonas populi TaxID=1701758 RepID=A0ABW5CM63_9HYPH|nr:ABC transporter ATP-binding protein [Aureimonas populi]
MSETAEPILSVRDLVVETIGYDRRPILESISLDVRAGETLCVVGESGSGKSVTSLAVMGLLPRKSLRMASGSIRLAGEELAGASGAHLRSLRATRMAMIFQEPMTALNPVLTVGRQIEEVLETHSRLGAGERRARVLDMLEKVHLPDIERVYRSYPHQLSGGQRQRIMIAMALVLQPKLLIADEPTTALDVTTQAQILLLIRELQEKHGTAVLFITHDMGVVADIADRVVVVRRGRQVEEGPVKRILAEPRETYTQDLLRSVPALSPRPARPETSQRTVLETIELTKRYHRPALFGKGAETVAADAVSFTLKRGRTLGIVGESGSGKSTVARCVMRLVDPSSGAIRVRGEDISDLGRAALRPHRRHIQMVFQDPNRSLNPRIPIGESIIEGPVNYGTPRAEALKRARELLDLVGLPPDAVTRHPHEFSGGQRQRIAIARALAMEPEIIVADEAVSALDVSVQAQVLDLLADIQERLGVAILFITHDLRVAAQICDDIIVMQKGRIVEQGEAARVLTAPAEAYTRALFEAAPGRHWDFPNFRPLGAPPVETAPS